VDSLLIAYFETTPLLDIIRFRLVSGVSKDLYRLKVSRESDPEEKIGRLLQ